MSKDGSIIGFNGISCLTASFYTETSIDHIMLLKRSMTTWCRVKNEFKVFPETRS